jgi:type VI secretion system protein ImpA
LTVSILSRRDTPLPAPPQQPSTAVAAGPAPEAPHHDDREPIAGRPIRTRDDAYKCLSEAADFLARTEPHSPTPYLVRRAIAWGGMRLEDLLPELVRSQDELGQIYNLLQIGRTVR